MTSAETTGSQPIRVALIGYGLAGSVFHAPLIDTTAGMSIAAIVTSNPERQWSAHQHYPQAKILDNVDALWQDADHYDLAVVATANNVHAAQSIAAMRAGLAVVVDKPLAATVADANKMLETSQETHQLFSVFQNRRWDNDFLTVQKFCPPICLDPSPTLSRALSAIVQSPVRVPGVKMPIPSEPVDSSLILAVI